MPTAATGETNVRVEETAEEKLFANICLAAETSSGADETDDVVRISRAVMEYLVALLKEDDEGAKTCREIVRMSEKLHSSGSPLRCVARRAKPPTFCARTHRNEPLPFYLQLANGDAEYRALLDEEQIDEAQNSARLKETGLRVRDRHEERKSAPHLKLPADLDTGSGDGEFKQMQFSRDSLQHFAPDVDPTLLVKHALDAANNTVSDHLCGTMIEVLRIGVPVQRWPATRSALRDDIEHRRPFAQQQTAIDSVKQDLIPVGFHALGATHDRTYATDDNGQRDENGNAAAASQRLVLVDLYAWQVRRFYVQLDQSTIDQLSALADDVSRLLESLATAAGVATCQLEPIKTLQDVQRAFVITALPPAAKPLQ